MSTKSTVRPEPPISERIPLPLVAIVALLSAIGLGASFFLYPALMIPSAVILGLSVLAAILKVALPARSPVSKEMDAIYKMPWKEFRGLLAEAYRLQGYIVHVESDDEDSGSIDLTMRRSGETTAVHCRDWASKETVSVKALRHLHGLMKAADAHSGIFITAGAFPESVKSYARKVMIKLVDGHDLLMLLHTVRNDLRFRPAPLLADRMPGTDNVSIGTTQPLPQMQAAPAPKPIISPTPAHARSASTAGASPLMDGNHPSPISSHAPAPSASPICPRCGSSMTKRAAQRGGERITLWLCARYPECSGTRDT